MARFAGGSIAISVYTTILTNVVGTQAVKKVIPAVLAAGGSEEVAVEILTALPLGASALAKIPDATGQMIAAAGGAFQQAYVVGLRTTALASLSFGIIAIIGESCMQCDRDSSKADFNSMCLLPRHRSQDDTEDRDLSRERRQRRQKRVPLNVNVYRKRQIFALQRIRYPRKLYGEAV